MAIGTIIGIANPDVSVLHIDGWRLGRIGMGTNAAIAVSPNRHALTTQPFSLRAGY
jgi:hypothetical protein